MLAGAFQWRAGSRLASRLINSIKRLFFKVV
jgi:hypothetical protein